MLSCLQGLHFREEFVGIGFGNRVDFATSYFSRKVFLKHHSHKASHKAAKLGVQMGFWHQAMMLS